MARLAITANVLRCTTSHGAAQTYLPLASRRSYHDTMYGYREPRKFTLPDCGWIQRYLYFTEPRIHAIIMI